MDFNIQKDILLSECNLYYKDFQKLQFINNLDTLYKTDIYDNLCEKFGFENFTKYAQKVNFNFYKRKTRLIKRVENLLTEECLFVTFTFTDSVLQHTKQDTRRKYIQRYLKNYNYVANIDFSPNKNREHYHAILQTTNIDLDGWQYGFIHYRHINISNSEKLATYITKLSNHAVKNSVKNNRVMYSR